MFYLIDGSNLLGRLRRDRESTEEKRLLVRAVSNALRERKGRGQLVFDGAAPAGFATQLGHLSVRFAAPRSADELIATEAGHRAPCTVVTSDLGLRSRVASRKISVISADDFARSLQQDDGGRQAASEDDWESYFSDEKNRNI